MGYSEAFINRTKEQLLEQNRRLSREIAALKKEHDIQVESYRMAVEENKRLHGDLDAKEESNKKLAAQFYEYREKLVGMSHELEGVRGALKREAEMRVEWVDRASRSEKERDDLREKLVKMEDELAACRKSLNDKAIENELLRNDRNEVEKIQRKHNMLTLEDIDNALKQWNYIDDKLSHDLCMPLESIIQLLDEYGVNDFCKLRERLMYGPTTDYIEALGKVRKLEKRNAYLEHVADDLEKQLRSKTGDCGDWMDRAFKSDKERDDLKKECRELKENFEKASRRNDELQNEVNRLYQRWTDEFNPEDELLGRKIFEWQEIDCILKKYGAGTPEKLEARLARLSDYCVPIKRHGVFGPNDLDCRLDLLEKYQKAAYDLQKSDGFKWIAETVSGRRE